MTPSEEKAAFQVRDRGTGIDLCLKIINPNIQMERLGRELQALSRLNHPNLSRLEAYHNTITQDGHKHAVVEPFIDGADLASRVQAGHPWALGEAAGFFAQILDGLEVLRGLDIVHRDLKPTNLRIATDGRPVVIDLGIARHLLLDPLTRTHQGARIGSMPYFSPEQWRGTYRDIDHRSDLFAVGIMLFEVVTGRHPFWTRRNMTAPELEANVCEHDNHWQFHEFQSLPSPWQTLLRKLLDRDRERRPLSAEVAARVLRKVGGVA